MNELMLDVFNFDEIKDCLEKWPVTGITTNPSILKNDGKIDIYKRLGDIYERLYGSLHVQVVSTKADDMIGEAKYIIDKISNIATKYRKGAEDLAQVEKEVKQNVYIKIPVTEEGLVAIKKLHGEDFKVTATAIYSTFQAVMAILAGANYVALYYDRMEGNGIDANQVISDTREFIDQTTTDCKILAASFKNASQVVNAYISGADAVTVTPNLIRAGLSIPVVTDAVSGFTKDFESVYGAGSTMKSV